MNIRNIWAFLSASLIGGAFLLVVIALSGGLAVAQIGGGGTPMTCATNVSVTPTLRGEGYSEQTGDITIVCTGGIPPTVGSAIPQINLTVFYNATVTSRLLPLATVSEALLLIDEPGSGLSAPVPGFGPGAPQNLCPTPLQGCLEFVSQAGGINVATDTIQGTTATTPGRNVFQSVVNGNSVTFFGIPVLAPGTTASRVFRITNVRVNANPLSGGISGANPVLASISISGSTTLLISNAADIVVGFVTNSLTASVSGSTSLDQCSSQNNTPVTTLSFKETFGTAFKTRVAAQNDLPYAGQNGTPGAGGFAAQNSPGGIYNSESGFVLPVPAAPAAGLSDFGTRLKAQFNNVPAGARLFVSVANVQNNGLPVAVPTVIGGNAANAGATDFAQLTTDETGAFGAVAPTTFAGTSGSVPVVEIPVVNGAATAVWEVINTNPNTIEVFRFAVYTTYTSNPSLNLPSPGTTTVNLSYAPTPPSFNAATAQSASDTLPVPRFVADANAASGILNITLGGCAVMNSPTPGATLSDTSATFSWSSTAGADQYWLDVGTSAGSGDIKAGPSTSPSQLVTGLPCDGRTLYVQFFTHFNGTWQGPRQYTYTATTGCFARIVSPGGSLTGTSATVTWNAAAGADRYWLDVGTSLGSGNISGGATTGTSLSVTGLPCDGRTLYVKLYTHLNGAWLVPQQYTITAATGCFAQVLSPLPLTTLSATTATFTWNAATGADQYWLDVGTSFGSGDIKAASTTSTSQSVTVLPCDGRTIYVQLYTHANNLWQAPQRYTYTAVKGCFAQLVSPVPLTTLPATATTFTWNAAAGADQYWLDVGTSLGSGDIKAASTTSTSLAAAGLPCDGRTLFVQLYTHVNKLWLASQRYTYTAVTGCSAQILSPVPLTTLSATSLTFAWTLAAGADQYWLDVGTSPGTGSISAGATALTSQTVMGLPCDGRPFYVQLYTHANGVWQTPQRYVYIATVSCTAPFAMMISPAPLTTLPATSVTFAWNAALGSDRYWLDVGSVPGSGIISSNGTTNPSMTVTGLPCDGRTLYIQLHTHFSSGWQVPQRYTYTAPQVCTP